MALLLRVVSCIDLSDRPELGVRTEDELNDGSRPLELACSIRKAITA
jgi:hypothetical protein